MKNSASAFCSPVIPLDSIPSEIKNKLLQEKHTVDDWMKKSLAIKRFASIKQDGDSNEDLEESEARVTKITDAATPYTVSKRFTASNPSFVVENFSPHRKILGGNLQEVTSKIREDPSMIPMVLREIEDSMMEAGELIRAISTDQAKAKKEVVDNVEALGLQLEKLHMDIGPRENISEDFQAPTIWGVLQAITNSITGGDSTTEGSSQESLRSLESFVKSRINDLDSQVNSASAHFKTLHLESRNKLQTLTSDSKAMIDSLRSNLVKGLQGLIGRVSAVEHSVSTLQQNLGNNSAFSTMGMGNSGNLTQQQQIDWLAKTSKLEAEIQGLKAVLQQGQADFQRLKTKMDTTAIKFGNLGLSTVDDCKAWVAMKFGSRAYGLFFDLPLILEWCAAQEHGDVLSMLTTMEKRHKMQIATTNEARALYAMKLEFPQFFYKDLPGTGRDPSFLTAMKDYEDWESPETGVRDRIINKIGTMHSMFGEQIAITMSGEPEARALATSMLSVSIGCCRELINYFDETMNELTMKSKFTTRKAFSLVTQVVRRFFMDLYKVRAQVYSSISTSDQSGQCAWVLYGVLRTHDVMAEYSTARFKNHPSVSSEYIRFLSTNSGFESLKTLEDKVDSMKQTMQVTVKDCQAAKKAADTANSTVDSVKKDVAELKKANKRRGGNNNNNNDS